MESLPPRCLLMPVKRMVRARVLVCVGVQHQNAKAERAIQTVVYMAREFMIHAALNWGEDGSDGIALWSFALDHASYLYTRIPQRESGIAPLEMVTTTKSDYADLVRAHV